MKNSKKKKATGQALTITREKFLYYRGIEAENQDLHDNCANLTDIARRYQYVSNDLNRKVKGLEDQVAKLRDVPPPVTPFVVDQGEIPIEDIKAAGKKLDTLEVRNFKAATKNLSSDE